MALFLDGRGTSPSPNNLVRPCQQPASPPAAGAVSVITSPRRIDCTCVSSRALYLCSTLSSCWSTYVRTRAHACRRVAICDARPCRCWALVAGSGPGGSGTTITIDHWIGIGVTDRYGGFLPRSSSSSSSIVWSLEGSGPHACQRRESTSIRTSGQCAWKSKPNRELSRTNHGHCTSPLRTCIVSDPQNPDSTRRQ